MLVGAAHSRPGGQAEALQDGGQVGGGALLGGADLQVGLAGRGRHRAAAEEGAPGEAGARLPAPDQAAGDPEAEPAGALAPRARYELVLADRVERVLTDSGVLDGAGRLSYGVPGALVRGREAAACFTRGAFLGRGSVSAPTREPHLEFGTPEERTAADLAAILTRLGLTARIGVRGPDEHRVVVKGGEAIGRTLLVMGAQAAYLAWEDGRIRREVRREAVRLANADHANLRRSVAAAMAQVSAVERAVARLGWDGLPADLAEVAALRLAHPDASLAELGAMLDPPRSKGGVLARIRRIEALTQPVGGSEE
jgi:DNA-binding protein WhiA